MARVTVELPPILTNPDPLIAEVQNAARMALDAELPSVLGEIATSGQVPHDRGTLTRAVTLAAQPARIAGLTRVVAEIAVAGEASAYAAVQDLGRRAGQSMSWRFLYYAPGQIGVADAWRGGWVNRKHRDWVLEVAASLRAKVSRVDTYGSVGNNLVGVLGAGPKTARRRLSRRSITQATFERRAAYLLAVGVASKIRARGMKGKRFIAGNRDLIAQRCHELVVAELNRVLTRWGAR